jgi:glutamate synthase domain-containing protein 3
VSAAAKILADWKNYVPKFVKVMPQGLQARARVTQESAGSQGLSGDEAIMAAFEENVKGRSLRRLSRGNQEIDLEPKPNIRWESQLDF